MTYLAINTGSMIHNLCLEMCITYFSLEKRLYIVKNQTTILLCYCYLNDEESLSRWEHPPAQKGHPCTKWPRDDMNHSILEGVAEELPSYAEEDSSEPRGWGGEEESRLRLFSLGSVGPFILRPIRITNPAADESFFLRYMILDTNIDNIVETKFSTTSNRF